MRQWVFSSLILACVSATLGCAHGAESFGVLRLRIGVVGAGQVKAETERLEPFRAYLAARLEIPVELQIFRKGQELVDAAAHRAIDYGVYTAATYAAAWRSCGCIEPIGAPRSIDGTAGVRSILVVRGDSPYLKATDLQGRSLAMAGQGSIAGHMIPVSELAGEGIDIAKLVSRVETVADPDAALTLLLDRKVDAAFAWSTLEGEQGEGYDRGPLHDLMHRGILDMHAIRIIWRSGLIPNGPHAVRDTLPLQVKSHLRDLLSELLEAAPDAYDAVEPNFSGGFGPVGHSAYLPLLRLVTPPGEDPMQPLAPKSPNG